MESPNVDETEPLLNRNSGNNSAISSTLTNVLPEQEGEIQALGNFRLFISLLVDSVPGMDKLLHEGVNS